MNAGRNERTLELLFRSLRGEKLSVKALAAGFEVSTKTVNRNINFSPRVRTGRCTGNQRRELPAFIQPR